MQVKVAESDDSAPTLDLRQFMPRAPGASWSSPISLRADAPRVGLVGDWQPLFELLVGRAETFGGTATVLGCALESAVSRGVLGYAACDPPLPGSFSVTEYLQHAARLSHGSASRAVGE